MTKTIKRATERQANSLWSIPMLALVVLGSWMQVVVDAVPANAEYLSNQISVLNFNSAELNNTNNAIASYINDPAGDNGGLVGEIDWNTITMTHDCDTLYVRYLMHDGPAFALEGYRYNLFVDVDKNPETGYRGPNLELSIGADALIQGSTVFAYTGGTAQESWGWEKENFYPFSDITLQDGGRDITYNIKISDLDVFAQGVPNFDWIAKADYTADSLDIYPDNGTQGEGLFNSYNLSCEPITQGYANPERGFIKKTLTQSSNYTPLNLSTLQCYRQNEGISLIQRIFYLEDFVNSDISNKYLKDMQSDFDTIRAAGLKMVIRFAYTAGAQTSTEGEVIYGDASKERILAHLEQLTDILNSNSDVIAIMQAGFIGLWGEWWSSDHFDPDGSWDDRSEIFSKMLEALPSTRMVQVRTPRYKQNIYSTANPLDILTAHDASALARTAHHNDCFLSSQSDGGTYIDSLNEYPYLEEETKWAAMGGETCDYNFLSNPEPNRLECTSAVNELSRFHWSYLNLDWYRPTLQKWLDDGCLPEIEQKLGYQFIFIEGTYVDQVVGGEKLQVRLQIENKGFSAPFNPRAVELILRHTDGTAYAFALSADPRFWLSGQTHTITDEITIPIDFPAGEYEVLLNLPDPEPSLQGRADYAIRLANEGTWEEKTGYNQLNQKITVLLPTFTYYPQAIESINGEYNRGTLTSFTVEDDDTYDMKAHPILDGSTSDWYASTTIAVPPAGISELTLTYKGQYSRRNIEQKFYLYNYINKNWELLDTRIVGNTDDVTIEITLLTPQAYIAADGTSRIRVRGFKKNRHQFAWWNKCLNKEISQDIELESKDTADVVKKKIALLSPAPITLEDAVCRFIKMSSNKFYTWANYLSWEVK